MAILNRTSEWLNICRTSDVTRNWFISILIFGSLLHWHWKASIISHLSVVLPDIPFSNGAELAESAYQITMMKGNALQVSWKFWNQSMHVSVSGCLWNFKIRAPETFLGYQVSGKGQKFEKYPQVSENEFNCLSGQELQVLFCLVFVQVFRRPVYSFGVELDNLFNSSKAPLFSS